MAVYKRKDGKSWRAVVRIKSHPAVCDHFDRKPTAKDWVRDTRNQIKLGQYKFDQRKKIHTSTQLLKQYIANGALEHHRFLCQPQKSEFSQTAVAYC